MASENEQAMPEVGAGFTKGPWSFRYFMEPAGKNDDNFHLIDGPEGDQGSSILEGAFVFPGTHSDALKIAHMIAEAPAVYAELENALLVLIGLHIGTGQQSETAERAIASGQAALSRARGEQQ